MGQKIDWVLRFVMYFILALAAIYIIETSFR